MSLTDLRAAIEIVGFGFRSEFSATAKLKNSEAIEREAAVQYVVGAFMGLLTWWLDRGATESVDRIDGLFQRFVREGVRA